MMAAMVSDLKAFLANPPLALVEVANAKGSTPREAGAWMLVSRKRIFGTIGGGQLEYMAIDKARQMLRAPTFRKFGTMTLDIPLGPEIGQCCGGRVEVSIRCVDKTVTARLLARAEADEAALPHIYVFGGGHVGHALASSLALLPARTIVVETRADELDGLPDSIETRLTPVPEEVVRDAPTGSAFLILTHDHALDFLIVAESLRRDDTAYVGMIGSKTKKATFRSWFMKNAGGTEAEFARLVSPIGGDAVKDKRPAVIAALASAEVMTALSSSERRSLPAKGSAQHA
jgi:xanthine dehydrogenase accessory factor